MFEWFKKIFASEEMPTNKRPSPPTSVYSPPPVRTSFNPPPSSPPRIRPMREVSRIEIELPTDRMTRGFLTAYDQYNNSLFTCRVHGRANSKLIKSKNNLIIKHAPSGSYLLTTKLHKKNSSSKIGEYVFILKPIAMKQSNRQVLLLHGGNEFATTDGSLRISSANIEKLAKLPFKKLPIRVDINDIKPLIIEEEFSIVDEGFEEDLMFCYNIILDQLNYVQYNIESSYQKQESYEETNQKENWVIDSVPYESPKPESYSSSTIKPDSYDPPPTPRYDPPAYEYSSSSSHNSHNSHSHNTDTSSSYSSSDSSSSSSDSSSSDSSGN